MQVQTFATTCLLLPFALAPALHNAHPRLWCRAGQLDNLVSVKLFSEGTCGAVGGSMQQPPQLSKQAISSSCRGFYPSLYNSRSIHHTQRVRCQPPKELAPANEQQLDHTAVSPISLCSAADVEQAATKPPAAVARSILARRSVVYEEALHRPLGLIAFGAYVLGSAASLVGE